MKMIKNNESYETKSNGSLVILNYIDAHNIKVKFSDTGHVITTRACQIKSGLVKDVMRRNIYGVGFIGVGIHKVSIKCVSTKAYQVWNSMIKRCYCPVSLNKDKCYRECSVCDDWHNFQNFAAWFKGNYIEGFHLDKDIKIDGNKVYSPKTCLFVSQADNAAKANAKSYIFNSPTGDIVRIYNLSDFCRRNNLHPSNMSAVNTGADKTYKGWTKYARV
jgi:hypothetical protein